MNTWVDESIEKYFECFEPKVKHTLLVVDTKFGNY